MGRAMRVVLPLGNGGIAHLFVIYGYQGAESDPEKLQLSEHLFAAVLAEAKMCCAGQPVILVGDFNADPTVIPSLAKGIMNGHWIDVEQAFATGRGVAPSRTCQFQLDEDEGSRRDFVLACPIAVAATTACRVLPDRWFIPHFAVYAEFSLSLHGMPLSIGLEFIHPCGQPVGLIVLIAPDVLRHMRFRISGTFTSKKSASYLGRLGNNSLLPVTPVAVVSIVLIVPMSLVSLTLAFFVNSSLAPVFRFRRRFVSVCNVLKGIKVHGFQRPGFLLYGIVGVPLFVWGLLALSPRSSPGPIGSRLIFMGFTSGLWTL